MNSPYTIKRLFHCLLALSILFPIQIVVADTLQKKSSLQEKVRPLLGLWQSDVLSQYIHLYKKGDSHFLDKIQYNDIGAVRFGEPIKIDEKVLAQISIINGQIQYKDAFMSEPSVYRAYRKIPVKNILVSESHDVMLNLNYFAEEFISNYAFFKEQGVTDKLEWARNLKSKLTANATAEQLYDLLKGAILSFNDNHVSLSKDLEGDGFVFPAYLKPSVLGEINRLQKTVDPNMALDDFLDHYAIEHHKKIIDTFVENKHQDDIFSWGIINNTQIGYVNILMMYGYEGEELESHIDKFIQFFNKQELTALVIDVRFNTGGDDAFGLAIANRFINERTPYYQVQTFYQGGELTPKRTVFGVPSNRIRFKHDIPLRVLVSGLTGSATEIFALSMREVPNCLLVGQPTMGILSDKFFRKLPNGWFVTLSNELRFSMDDKLYEGVGVPANKNLRLRLVESLQRPKDVMIAQVVDLLKLKTP